MKKGQGRPEKKAEGKATLIDSKFVEKFGEVLEAEENEDLKKNSSTEKV